jgi:arsenate reductase-like glutaredoxin family protein
VDERSRVYQDSGLAYMRVDDSELFERLLTNQGLLRLPLVRGGNQVSVGHDERTWRSWLGG